MSTITNYEEYRAIYDRVTFPAQVGIVGEGTYNNIVADDRTAWTLLSDSRRIPYVVASDHLEFVNHDYFAGRHTGQLGVCAALSGKDQVWPVRASAFSGILEIVSLMGAEEPLATTIESCTRSDPLVQQCDGRPSMVCFNEAFIGQHTEGEVQRHNDDMLASEQFEAFWANVYEPAFMGLSREFPIFGIQHKDELAQQINAQTSMRTYTSHSGHINCLGLVVPAREYPEFAPGYIDRTYGENSGVYYCPVVVASREGERSVLSVARGMGAIMRADGPATLLYDCPNRSQPQVDIIVRSMRNRSQKVIRPRTYARQLYRLLLREQ